MSFQCRICKSTDCSSVASLGQVPLAGDFLAGQEQTYEKFGLDLLFCNSCKILQVKEEVPANRLFGNYHYASSQVSPLLEHFERYAAHVKAEHSSLDQVRILEIGCNDLPFLRWFEDDSKYDCLGIDPSFASIKRRNIERLEAFFSKDFAGTLLSRRERYDFIYAANVFAHISDLNDVLGGLSLLCKKNGRIVIEVHDCLQLLSSCQFDTIYHEHIYYHSVTSLWHLAQENGLEVVDLSVIDTHGGSLRVSLAHHDSTVVDCTEGHSRLAVQRQLLLEEKALPQFAKTFSEVYEANVQTYSGIIKLLSESCTLGAYGMAGRAVMFLNALGLGKDQFAFFIDDSSARQGKYIPGFSAEISPPTKLSELDKESIVVITAWNYVGAICERLEKDRYRGMAIVFLPKPKIVYIAEDISSEFIRRVEGLLQKR